MLTCNTITGHSGVKFDVKGRHLPPDLFAVDLFFVVNARLAEQWRGIGKRERSKYVGGFKTYRAQFWKRTHELTADIAD